MMLRTGGDVRFKLRPIKGAMPLADVQPERLILDGQQRLPSLFQSLASGKPVQTQDVRKHPVSGWFHMDMRLALDPYADREEAIVFPPADRMQRNFRGEVTADYSAAAKKYQGFSRDLPEVCNWIRGTGPQPRTVDEAQFAPGRLLALRTRGSAAYKGIYALLLKEGAIDWRTGEVIQAPARRTAGAAVSVIAWRGRGLGGNSLVA